MIRVGIVGSENSHTVAIARILNIEKKVRGCRVVCVWGETVKFAKSAAERGQIPEIVKEPADMIGKVDAAMVDHRHPMYHLPAAAPLLEAKIPLFIDKPFCYRLREGRKFLARAHELGVPVTSYSAVVKRKAFVKLQRDAKKLGRVLSVVSTGSCDIKSKYGGVFFYGIHQIDMVVRLLGNDVTHVQANLGKKNHTATLFSADGAISTVNMMAEGRAPFHVSVIGEKGRIDGLPPIEEPSYLSSAREFCKMFRTGETVETDLSILKPIAVLEAIEKSIQQKRKVKVASI